MSISEFRESALDVLRQAKLGDQTAVVDAGGKIRMVIGVSKNSNFPEPPDDPELEDVDVSDLSRSTWLD